ncbi:MAG TPA: PASTA domain-containing protein, partial [Solirubrobacteraceae bacterium]
LIQYYYGGPIGPPLRISAEEDERLIRVLVYMRQPRVVQGYPTVGRGGQTAVKLASLIGGRLIIGPTREQMRSREYRLWDDRGNSKLVVPRVLGLAPDDAKAVLRSQRFEPVLHGAPERAGEVVSQSPPPETTVAEGTGSRGRVQLTVG